VRYRKIGTRGRSRVARALGPERASERAGSPGRHRAEALTEDHRQRPLRHRLELGRRRTRGRDFRLAHSLHILRHPFATLVVARTAAAGGMPVAVPSTLQRHLLDSIAVFQRSMPVLRDDLARLRALMKSGGCCPAQNRGTDLQPSVAVAARRRLHLLLPRLRLALQAHRRSALRSRRAARQEARAVLHAAQRGPRGARGKERAPPRTAGEGGSRHGLPGGNFRDRAGSEAAPPRAVRRSPLAPRTS